MSDARKFVSSGSLLKQYVTVGEEEKSEAAITRGSHGTGTHIQILHDT